MIPASRLGTAAHLAAGLGVLGAAGYAFVAVVGHVFHGPADAKTNAGVVVPVKEMSASPLKGEATLTDAQAADLQAGKWYFNVHTAANKGGEIRGQVMKK